MFLWLRSRNLAIARQTVGRSETTGFHGTSHQEAGCFSTSTIIMNVATNQSVSVVGA